ncbi:site-2 protease family protein [Dehalobacter sp. DCM]|uniref:site-2 protease family protein n=1 Tax=Dehalobacter sp. DCM TaxID=2907827 RepID=UPI0030817535|nr:site-2 protease family protein [Dehalobacter sp. DCM]
MNFDLIQTLYILPGIIIGFTFHEFAHAQVAVWLGDDTPRLQGRLSLNPRVHIDIIGLILIIFARFGWAKPVEVNPNNFKNKTRDDILVSLAGPVMNILVAICFFILVRVVGLIPGTILEAGTATILADILDYGAYMNVVLAVFNLVPVPPLDGSSILFGLLGWRYREIYYRLQQMSWIILLVLIFTGIISFIIGPPIMFIYSVLSSIFY